MRTDPHTTDAHHSRQHTGDDQTAAPLRMLDEETTVRNEPRPAAAHPTSGADVELNVVSKHPDATIPESDISLADIERKRAHPLRTLCYIVLVLAALILPYWARTEKSALSFAALILSSPANVFIALQARRCVRSSSRETGRPASFFVCRERRIRLHSSEIVSAARFLSAEFFSASGFSSSALLRTRLT